MTKVIRSVAGACEIDQQTLRNSRGGAARMLAAWIGWNQGLLRLREVNRVKPLLIGSASNNLRLVD